MLSKAKTLTGYKLHSLDGEIGKVKEFYFDDRHWTVRYLVADTGSWLTGRQVLISPHALAAVNQKGHNIAVNLTKKQIEDSPSLRTDKPVSRQFEESYYGYYGWPVYWSGSSMWGAYPYPYTSGAYPGIVSDRAPSKESARRRKAWNPDLRSTQAVRGYHIQAANGKLGHVTDFIIDDETWAIRYLIIDTRDWWPGKKVLVSPQWIKRVSWSESKVFVALSRAAIKQSPEYTEESLPTRDYEIRLHGHYNRQGYWVDELAAKADRPARKRQTPVKSSSRKQQSPRYICPSCGEEFLSLIELRAHKKKYQRAHRRPPVRENESPDIVKDIEARRDRADRRYRGYREVDRSS